MARRGNSRRGDSNSRFTNTLLLAITAFAWSAAASHTLAAPGVQSFDADWRFNKGDAPGAEAPAFDDSAWQTLNVPHDWSIAGPFERDAPAGRGGAFLPTGVGWYQKHFKLPAEGAGKRVSLEFDGVMSHSTVWINGEKLGERPFGYVTFRYDLTPHVKFGDDADNIITVRVDTSRQPASRWYAGSGIERHVRLVTSEPVRFRDQGVFATTPRVFADAATVRIAAEVINDGDAAEPVSVLVELRDRRGDLAAKGETDVQTIAAGATVRFELHLVVSNPRLWSPDKPARYSAAICLNRHGQLVIQDVAFGIREFHFEPDTGFWLNNQNIKLKGVCLHADGGAVGMAVPKAVYRRRLERLKSLGVNAVRTAHHPFSPEFLDLCDEMGFLVMHEVFDCWTVGKNNAQEGYNREFKDWWERDLRDAVLRDRNHPSIILYSAGNEIRDNLKSPAGFDQFKAMKKIYDELDGTRPVTMAIFRPNQSGVYTSGFSELMDVVGQNYRDAELVRAHRDKPTRKVLGTENGHGRDVWLVMRDNPFLAGQFLWTGIDYLGEADWPYTTWGDALLDRTGIVKPTGLQRQSWWSDKPMVAMVRSEAASGGASGRGAAELVDHWTPRDADTYDEATVYVYSNCEEVELVLNGESLGKKPMPKDASPAEYRFPFDPGTCEAIGSNGGKEVARQTLKSAGAPAGLKVTADRDSCTSNWDDVVHVEVEVVDAEGVRCPWSDAEIKFELTGPGALVAVDNGDLQSHESFQEPHRQAFHGRALAIVRPTADSGTVTLKATAEGLAPATVEIKAAK